MKKVITYALILALLAGCVPALAEDDAMYVGTWIFRDSPYPVDLVLEILHLAEDHTAYYIYQAFDNGKATTGAKRIGSWTNAGDHIEISLGSKEDLQYTATCQAFAVLSVKDKYNKSKPYLAMSNDLLTKMADEKLNPSATAAPTKAPETGVYVPGGYWIVGVDIPAGTYSVRNPENIKSQNFVIFDAYNEESGYYTRTIINTILGKDNAIIGKVTLKDGNIVEVYKGVYFDAPVMLGF